MKVTLMLADAAQAVGNKLYILGGGWSRIIVGAPYAIAIKVEVPWSEATAPHTLRLELVDSDGEPVLVPQQDGEELPAMIETTFTTGIPPQVRAGTPMDVALAVPVGPLALEPGKRYEWRLTLDGRVDENWSLAFEVVAAPPSAQAA